MTNLASAGGGEASKTVLPVEEGKQDRIVKSHLLKNPKSLTIKREMPKGSDVIEGRGYVGLLEFGAGDRGDGLEVSLRFPGGATRIRSHRHGE